MEPFYFISSAPSGRLYADLLAYLESHASAFTLVCRDQLRLDESAEDLLRQLAPLLVAEERTDEWPGTKIFESLANVRKYRVCPEATCILQASDSLYGWVQPQRPEDLTFYDEAGACCMYSIAHEREAWINSELINISALESAVPGLQVHANRWSNDT